MIQGMNIFHWALNWYAKHYFPRITAKIFEWQYYRVPQDKRRQIRRDAYQSSRELMALDKTVNAALDEQNNFSPILNEDEDQESLGMTNLKAMIQALTEMMDEKEITVKEAQGFLEEKMGSLNEHSAYELEQTLQVMLQSRKLPDLSPFNEFVKKDVENISPHAEKEESAPELAILPDSEKIEIKKSQKIKSEKQVSQTLDPLLSMVAAEWTDSQGVDGFKTQKDASQIKKSVLDHEYQKNLIKNQTTQQINQSYKQIGAQKQKALKKLKDQGLGRSV